MGFVLASVGIIYVYATGSVPPITIALTAQRGVGGFIFLALPFFILAGFLMDRGGVGARIVDFLCAVIGHVRGGLLHVLIAGMYIASGISGSKAADLAALGGDALEIPPRIGSCRRHGARSSVIASLSANEKARRRPKRVHANEPTARTAKTP